MEEKEKTDGEDWEENVTRQTMERERGRERGQKSLDRKRDSLMQKVSRRERD